jgi:hypothetical protein
MAEGKKVLLSTIEVEGFIDAATEVYDPDAYDPIIKAMISRNLITKCNWLRNKKIKVRAFIEMVEIDD